MGGKDEARSSFTRLKQLWDTWMLNQIDDRDEINILENEDPDKLAAEIRALVPSLSDPDVEITNMENAVEVGRRRDFYYNISKERNLKPTPIPLTADEQDALVAERETLFSQGKMLRVISTISLCGFLQGFVQSSVNAASLACYAWLLGIEPPSPDYPNVQRRDWYLGLMNSSLYLAAAIIGCPPSLIINYLVGRRGAILFAALLSIASSIAAVFTVPAAGSNPGSAWISLLGVRIITGIAMGVKAVSAPILASETSLGFWRGSTLLSWQLWVAFGIMVGNAVNKGLASIGSMQVTLVGDEVQVRREGDPELALRLILGATVVPASILLISVAFCYESPRFYMRRGTPNYNPARAWQILESVRNTKLQALRDLFLIRWSNREHDAGQGLADKEKPDLTYAHQLYMGIKFSHHQYKTLFGSRRIRNALYSACTVALAQQFSGINVLAFYSNTLFGERLGRGDGDALTISIAFGAVNFVFGLLAIKSIDTAGRRRWLLVTLPLMSLFLLIAATVLPRDLRNPDLGRSTVSIVFIFLFSAAYSPSLGPIPFTLASEAFPLSHREAGASVTIFINLLFAGIFTLVYPAMDSGLTTPGVLGFFSASNLLVFGVVFLIVEETRRLNLEELDQVYGQPKTRHMKYQVGTRLPYLLKRHILRRQEDPPPTYDELIAQSTDTEVGNSDELHRRSCVAMDKLRIE